MWASFARRAAASAAPCVKELLRREATVFQFENLLQPREVDALLAFIKEKPGYNALNPGYAAVPQAPWGTGEGIPRDAGAAEPPRPWFVPTPDGAKWIYDPNRYAAVRRDVTTARRLSAEKLAELKGFMPNSSGLVVRGDLAADERELDPRVTPLFRSPALLDAAARLHEGRPFIVPMAAFLNIGMPGANSQLHADNAEFRGVQTFMEAKENPFPDWLLTVMQRSGLFADYEVHYATAVFFPQHPQGGVSAGDLLLFADGPDDLATRHRAFHNTAVMSNNVKVFHVAAHEPVTERARTHAPKRSNAATITWHEDRQSWVLVEEGRDLASYDTEDLRLSVQMLVGCFRDRAEYELYRAGGESLDMSVDEVFRVLEEDLARRGLYDLRQPLPRSPTAEDPELYTLQDLCLDTYARPPSAELVDLSYRSSG